MNEISEGTWNEELNGLFLVKNSVQRKLYSTEYNMEIQKLEQIQNTHYLSHCVSSNLKTTIVGRYSMDW